MKTFFANSRHWFRAIALPPFVQGLLGGALVLGMALAAWPASTRIGSVDITSLVNRFVKTQAALNLPPQALQARVNDFGHSLQRALNNVSRQQHVVLLVQQAVIAGATDYTPAAQNALTAEAIN